MAGHWPAQAFHAAHWREGQWLGEAPGVGHWTARAFHASHWREGHWVEAVVPGLPGRPAYTGDLRLVIGLSALTRGSRPAQGFGGTAVWTLPLRHTYDGDLRLVVALQAVTAIRRAPRPTAYRAPARLGVRVALGSVSRAGDYVAEVVLPDDDEVLTIFAGGRR